MSENKFQVGGRPATYVLIICCLLYMVNFMDRSIFAVVLEPMKKEFGLTDAQCGMVQTIFLASMFVFSFPAGYLVDRWSRKKSLGIMAIAWSIMTYFTGLGKSFIGVLIPRALTGVGEAGFAAAGIPLISASYPEKERAKKLGIFNAFLLVGAVFGYGGGAILAQKFGWHTPFYFFAIPGVILGILAFFMQDYPNRPKAEDGKESFFKNIAFIWSIPTMRWTYLGYGLAGFVANSFNVWAPTMFIRGANMTVQQAGMTMLLFALLSIAGPILGGKVADKMREKKLNGRPIYGAIAILAGSFLTVLGLYFVVFLNKGSFTDMGAMLIIGIIVLGISQGVIMSANVALGAITQDVVQVHYRGLSAGLTVAFMYLFGGAWAPAIIGKISDALGGGKDGLFTALFISQMVGIICMLVFFRAAKFYTEDFQKANESN
jgi:MFS family permease